MILQLLENTGLATVISDAREEGACKDVLNEGPSLWRAGLNRRKNDTTYTQSAYDLQRFWVLCCMLIWAAVFDLYLIEGYVWTDLFTMRHLQITLVQLAWTVIVTACGFILCRFFRYRFGPLVFHEMMAAVDGGIKHRNLTAAEQNRARKARVLLSLHGASEGGYWRPYTRADELAMHNRLSRLMGRICDPNDAEHDPTFINMRAKERRDVVVFATACAFLPTERDITSAMERRMELAAARSKFMLDENRAF